MREQRTQLRQRRIQRIKFVLRTSSSIAFHYYYYYGGVGRGLVSSEDPFFLLLLYVVALRMMLTSILISLSHMTTICWLTHYGVISLGNCSALSPLSGFIWPSS